MAFKTVPIPTKQGNRRSNVIKINIGVNAIRFSNLAAESVNLKTGYHVEILHDSKTRKLRIVKCASSTPNSRRIRVISTRAKGKKKYTSYVVASGHILEFLGRDSPFSLEMEVKSPEGQEPYLEGKL